MFVVRIAGPAKEDWKAFQMRADALHRFTQARRLIEEDELDEVHAVVFHVPGETDARGAVERIKEADSEVIIVEKSWVSLSAEQEAQIMVLVRGDAGAA